MYKKRGQNTLLILKKDQNRKLKATKDTKMIQSNEIVGGRLVEWEIETLNTSG